MSSSNKYRPNAIVGPRLCFAAWVALVMEVGTIVWFASFGQDWQVRLQSFFMLGDRSVHMLAFLVAGLTASLAARSVIWPALALSVVAGIVEIIQIIVPGRSPSTVDFAASMVGIVGGQVLGALLNRAGFSGGRFV